MIVITWLIIHQFYATPLDHMRDISDTEDAKAALLGSSDVQGKRNELLFLFVNL